MNPQVTPAPPTARSASEAAGPSRPPQDPYDAARGRPSAPPAAGAAAASPSRSGERRRTNGYEPARELGATVAPLAEHFKVPSKRLKAHAQNAPKYGVPSLKPPKIDKAPQRQGARTAVAILIAAGTLAVAGVVFAMLWPGRGPLAARVFTDAQGREMLEMTCSSCPDGTTLYSGQTSASVAGGVATLAPAAPLAPGENRMKIRIDRPGSGRDETVTVTANVSYRIHSEISTLQGERPSIQVIIEAAKGTRVVLDGRAVPLYAGRATETFDVTYACTGLAADARSLSRQIPYVVTTPGGEVEKGTVNVVLGIVPLELDAPGPNVIIDGPSFVIAGRTLKGAELLAAGKPIPVKPDGSFAHVMNVSSVGATQIEVRAKLAGMAPRIARIKVRRVDNLETAAREFAAEQPIAFGALAAGVAQSAGKAIVVGGQVLEAKREGHRMTMLLDAGPQPGCQVCVVRLVLGAENLAQPGDKLTAYGRVLRAVTVPDRGEVPEVQVDFVLKGPR